MTDKLITLLLTSAGSLVGQNILDVLEYPGYSRRSLVRVVATSSEPGAAGNFRSDRCYLVPLTATAEYGARMRDILRQEQPDLILCCRDEDTYALSRLKSEHPELPGALPVGPPHAALIGEDKWHTWQFAQRHGLPFAETFVVGESGDGATLAAFCRRVGYPLVAKPRRGNASRGVCFIRNASDAEAIARRPSYLFQEYVGDPRDLEPYFATLQGPPPLFAQSPSADYRVAHTIIAPSGERSPISISDNATLFGHTYQSSRVEDPVIDTIASNYARALFSEGGTGPMNVQLRQNHDGAWKGLEINLRTSGALARLLMGEDELGFLVNAFVPGAAFPHVHLPGHRCDVVAKRYYSYPVPEEQASIMRRVGVWSRS